MLESLLRESIACWRLSLVCLCELRFQISDLLLCALKLPVKLIFLIAESLDEFLLCRKTPA